MYNEYKFFHRSNGDNIGCINQETMSKRTVTIPGLKTYPMDRKRDTDELVAEEDRERVRESKLLDTSSYGKVIQRPYKVGFGWGAPAGSYYALRLNNAGRSFRD